MINLEENLKKIGEMTGIRLRVGVCMCLGYTENPGESWSDPDGKVYDSALHLPPFETDLRWAFELMQKYGLALVPQSDEKGWRWLCTDLNAVRYGDAVVLESKESTGFGDLNPCVAVCQCFLACELVIDWARENKENAIEPVNNDDQANQQS